jgi:predicted ribosomally synthesized peptide with SipW-like signal peptide
MSDDNQLFDLTRRKVLGSIGALGVGAALGGAGTAAFFSDEERFENNQLTAGSLDLKVDWTQHYYDGSGDSLVNQYPTDGEILSRAEIEAKLDNDATEEEIEAAFRAQFADVPDDIQGPLIDLDDVKPGDRGEVTFSLHLFDNPGYVWMNGTLVDASENDVVEPEADDSDEDQVEGEGNPDLKQGRNGEKTVELLDEIQARAWYDRDGDNEKDPGEPLIAGPASLRDVLAQLDQDPGVKLDDAKFEAPTNATTNGGNGTDDIPDSSAFTCEIVQGNPQCEDYGYDLGFKFETEEDELPDGNDWTTITQTKTVDSTEYTVSVEVLVVSRDGGDPQKIKWRNLQIKEGDGDFVEAGAGHVIVKGGDAGNVCTPDEGPASGAGDQVFHSPPKNDNIPGISHLDFCIEEIGDNGDTPPSNGEECLENSTTRYVGFEWWLPLDHGNEIQTDSVTFDLGFYTEQCRHNDGSGMTDVTTSTGDGWAKQEENFNGDGTESSFARGRFGDNIGTAGDWEVGVGDDTNNLASTNYEWTSGQTVDWTYQYDAANDEATFTVDDATAGPYTLSDQPDGRLAIQAKADESTVAVENLQLSVDGSSQSLDGPTAVTATNDDNGGGRDLEYLVMDTALSGDDDVTLSGSVTVTVQGDYPGSREGVAFDVVLE